MHLETFIKRLQDYFELRLQNVFNSISTLTLSTRDQYLGRVERE